MDTISIVLQYNGHWDRNGKYVDFCVDGILVSSGLNFEELSAAIAQQLRVDTAEKHIEIKYKLNERSPPMEIYNDMGVRFYFQQKMDIKDAGMYPLCIFINEAMVDLCVPLEDSVVCSKNHQGSSNMNEVNNGEIYAIQSAFTPKLIGMGNSEGDETEDAILINNPQHKDVAEGQIYQDKATLVSTMKHFAVREKFQFKVDRSSRTSYCLECTGKNCTWKFRASSLNASSVFKIRKFNDVHTCLLKERLSSQRQATARIIGSIIRDRLDDPKAPYRPKDIITSMKKEYGLELPYMKAWRAKEMALQMIRGNPSESYQHLPSYLYMLCNTNPGSVVGLQVSDEGRFMYVFVALNASIKGWEFCRPIMVVDGSFLKKGHKGTFLSANTLDAAGCILPLAFGVVDSENDASWEWFFHHLREAYGIREDMCIVSDRNESIWKASSIVYPEVPHYACIWHLWNNIRAKFKKAEDNLHDLFFALAKAYTVREFDSLMKKVVEMDPRVKDYLYNIGYNKWARAHSTANRAWTMTSNIAETVNSVNKDARDMPVLPFIEYMRTLVETWTNNHRESANVSSVHLGKKYNELLNARRVAALRLKVMKATGYYFTIIEPVPDGQIKFLVDLNERTCCCRRFQMDEMPCQHAVAALKFINIDPETFCSPYYTREYLVKTYEAPVFPLPDVCTWDVPVYVSQQVVLPPIGRKPPGRPKKTRFKSALERYAKKSKITCGVCGRVGHNKKTCKNVPGIV